MPGAPGAPPDSTTTLKICVLERARLQRFKPPPCWRARRNASRAARFCSTDVSLRARKRECCSPAPQSVSPRPASQTDSQPRIRPPADHRGAERNHPGSPRASSVREALSVSEGIHRYPHHEVSSNRANDVQSFRHLTKIIALTETDRGHELKEDTRPD